MITRKVCDVRATVIRVSLALLLTSACHDRQPVARPPDDMIAVPAQTFVGDATRCITGTTTPQPVRERLKAQLTVPAFRIDRHPARCEDFTRCVGAGACKHEDVECENGLAVARRKAAAAYCGWRNARLPSWNEWQLAIRGPEGWDYPTREERDEYDYPAELGGTKYVSPLGIEYVFNAKVPLNQEATRDDDCWNPDPEREGSSLQIAPIFGFTHGKLHASLGSESLDRVAFRCVRD